MAVIQIDDLIDTNKLYQIIIKEIEESQNKFSKILNEKETEIENKYIEIESSKLILNEKEMNIIINDYNESLNDYNNTINEFNNHYQNEIIKIRKILLKEIIVIAEKYAKDNEIDLILDSTSYLIASNKLDITNIIKNELDKKIINLEFNKFEKH